MEFGDTEAFDFCKKLAFYCDKEFIQCHKFVKSFEKGVDTKILHIGISDIQRCELTITFEEREVLKKGKLPGVEGQSQFSVELSFDEEFAKQYYSNYFSFELIEEVCRKSRNKDILKIYLKLVQSVYDNQYASRQYGYDSDSDYYDY